MDGPAGLSGAEREKRHRGPVFPQNLNQNFTTNLSQKMAKIGLRACILFGTGLADPDNLHRLLAAPVGAA
jgi:hypothetical protein